MYRRLEDADEVHWEILDREREQAQTVAAAAVGKDLPAAEDIEVVFAEYTLRREGIDIGREQTARLMRLAGVSGKGKGKSPITTHKTKGPDLRPDLVDRMFKAPAPGRLWVADITYVRTRKGFVYTAFVIDVFSRRIVGWALSDSMLTEALPLQALNQAIVSAKETTGLIHH